MVMSKMCILPVPGSTKVLAGPTLECFSKKANDCATTESLEVLLYSKFHSAIFTKHLSSMDES